MNTEQQARVDKLKRDNTDYDGLAANLKIQFT
jgi:hypothetical protein